VAIDSALNQMSEDEEKGISGEDADLWRAFFERVCPEVML
jgi:hypothetical protein